MRARTVLNYYVGMHANPIDITILIGVHWYPTLQSTNPLWYMSIHSPHHAAQSILNPTILIAPPQSSPLKPQPQEIFSRTYFLFSWGCGSYIRLVCSGATVDTVPTYIHMVHNACFRRSLSHLSNCQANT